MQMPFQQHIYTSVISDRVCTEWVDLVHRQIPTLFWQNLDASPCILQDEARWRSVREFADNCVKRRAFEDEIRKSRGMKGEEDVVVPEGGVPKDILMRIHLESGKDCHGEKK